MFALYATPTVPFGKVAIVSDSGAGLIIMLSGPLTVSCGELESVAFTVSVLVPCVVGVPLTTHPFSVSPAGSVPAVKLHEYGAVPPLTPMVALYGTPTVPFGSMEFASTSGAGAIVMLSGPVVDSCGLLESVAVTVTLLVPGTVGVPLTVHPLSASPAGNVPAAIVHAYGAVPPLTPMVAL
jgi:hypothetical protein